MTYSTSQRFGHKMCEISILKCSAVLWEADWSYTMDVKLDWATSCFRTAVTCGFKMTPLLVQVLRMTCYNIQYIKSPINMLLMLLTICWTNVVILLACESPPTLQSHTHCASRLIHTPDRACVCSPGTYAKWTPHNSNSYYVSVSQSQRKSPRGNTSYALYSGSR